MTLCAVSLQVFGVVHKVVQKRTTDTDTATGVFYIQNALPSFQKGLMKLQRNNPSFIQSFFSPLDRTSYFSQVLSS